MMTTSAKQLIDSLNSFVCPGCGGGKLQRKSFCITCYNQLTPAEQNALYRRIGDGYEQAFAAALRKIKAGAPGARTGSGNRVEDVRLTFGKHSGKTLGDVLACDAAYLDWLADIVTSENLKRAVTEMCQKYEAEIDRAIQEREWRHDR